MGLSNPIHIAFVLVLLLLVFGAKRLPEMGRSLGSGMRGFKETLSGEAEPHQASAVEAPVPTPAAIAAAEPLTPSAEPLRHLAVPPPPASVGRTTTPAA
ncbi:MAG TPA: twin-arginine translocase TatA/TatE family subunit [Solirubrobacteraceae bacterium]|jgi:sec-independent protein translocase protein TatA|nr:twin-arginine translocase TatA/TatE family subunit [Solirubrobacteraceae bacterium]